VRGPIVISGAVEGLLDEAIVRRLVEELGVTPGSVYGKYGKAFLREKIDAYNQAARFAPWVVIVDLDHDADCAPPFRESWLPNPAQYMCFRVAVREIEAWLVADRNHLAKFLSVGASRIPQDPEALDNPKRTMVDIAKFSRRRDIREDMVPQPDSGRKVGPAYTSRLIEFVRDPKRGWQPSVAAESSDSLNRCIHRLEQLIRGSK
jgi:hypothetical protein